MASTAHFWEQRRFRKLAYHTPRRSKWSEDESDTELAIVPVTDVGPEGTHIDIEPDEDPGEPESPSSDRRAPREDQRRTEPSDGEATSAAMVPVSLVLVNSWLLQ